MDQYHPGEHAYSNPAAIDRTSVYRLEIEVDEKEKETAQIAASLLGMPTAFFPKSPWARASRPRAVPPVGKAQKHMMEVSSGKKADTLALAAIGEVCARQAFRNLGLARFFKNAFYPPVRGVGGLLACRQQLSLPKMRRSAIMQPPDI